MLKGSLVSAKIPCIKRKKLLHRPKVLELVGRKGSRKSQREWGDGHYYQPVLSRSQGFQSLSLKHAPDTALKCWDALSLKEVHLCKIHNGLENKERRKQSHWKGSVQKTGDLILGEQMYGYTMVHYKLFLYEERTVTSVIVKPKETPLPTPKKVNLRCKSI